MPVLCDLYRGILIANDYASLTSDEYIQAKTALKGAEKELYQMFTAEQKEQFEKYLSIRSEVEDLEQEDYFGKGFTWGVRLTRKMEEIQ